MCTTVTVHCPEQATKVEPTDLPGGGNRDSDWQWTRSLKRAIKFSVTGVCTSLCARRASNGPDLGTDSSRIVYLVLLTRIALIRSLAGSELVELS